MLARVPEPPLPTAEPGAMRHDAVRGGVSALASEGVLVAARLAATMVLARLLTPADFGLVAMVGTWTRLVSQFRTMGLASVTVQRREIDDDQLSFLFWANVAIGAVATGLTALLAPLVARFYGEPDLLVLTLALSASFLLMGGSGQHEAVLRRRLRFGTIAGLRTAAAVASTAIGVGAALAGAGVWSLVIMQLTSVVLLTLLLSVGSGFRASRPKLRVRDAAEMLRFGGRLTLSRLLGYATRNTDDIVVGRFFGDAALGFYSRAYQLLLFPIQRLTTPLTGVIVPVLSRLQDDPDRLRRSYRRALGVVTMLTMPIVAGCFVVADELFPVLLGDQWGRAVPLFKLLAPAAFVSGFSGAASWLWVSLGQIDRQLRWSLIAAPAQVAAFGVGALFGPWGIAASFSIGQCALRLASLPYCYRTTPADLGDFAAAVWRPAVTSVAAGAATLLLAGAIAPELAPAPLLAAKAVLYAALLGAAWLAVPGGPRELRETLALARELRSKKHA